LSRYSNKIESVGLRKCPYYRYLIEKVTSTDGRITNISQSLPHKMAENSRYEEITSLSPYVYTNATHRRTQPGMSRAVSTIIKSSAVAEMGDRLATLATIDSGRKVTQYTNATRQDRQTDRQTDRQDHSPVA